MVAAPAFVVFADCNDDVAAAGDVDYTESCEYCLDLLCCTSPFDNYGGYDDGLVFDCQNSADSIGFD